MSRVILEMKGITKRFPGVVALDNVDLTLHDSEVLALLGENGAGKSTLLKVLSGVYIPDTGEIALEGQKCVFAKPQDGFKAGISIIHQELNYLDELTIGENIFLGRLPKKRGFIDWKRVHEKSMEALAKVGLTCSSDRVMKTLSIAERQLVEIAKAVSRSMKVLVMDEPTSALSDEEVDSLLKLVRRIAQTGIGVIYISHKLREIYEVADNVEILRDGQSVALFDVKEVGEDQLIAKMVGRDLETMYPKREIQRGDMILKIENLSSAKVHDINLELHSGEILGIFGLMGAGRTAMAETIFGREPKKSGSVEVCGKPVRIRTPNDAKLAGIGYVPSDRKNEGLILEHSVANNISTATFAQLKHRLFISNRIEESNAQKWIKRFNIKTPSMHAIVKNLSGGNQQKVVLSKWMQTKPRVLILNEPTRGIDVGAKAEIYTLMEEFCEEGMGIIMISSELPELLALCDRVAVMAEGTITGEISDRASMSQEALMKLAVSRGENQP